MKPRPGVTSSILLLSAALSILPQSAIACNEDLRVVDTRQTGLEVTLSDGKPRVCGLDTTKLQTLDLIFNSTYFIKGVKYKGRKLGANLAYSRPADDTPYSRVYRYNNEDSLFYFNEYIAYTMSVYILNSFSPKIVADRMRITMPEPLSQGDCFSLSFASQACRFPELESYTMAEPLGRRDSLYDGSSIDGTLVNGLGTLTLVADQGEEDYVEWREADSPIPVELDFQFTAKQNLSSVLFHFPPNRLSDSPGRIRCVPKYSPTSDPSAGQVVEATVASEAEAQTVSLDAIAHAVKCTLHYRTASIALMKVSFNSRNATAAEIEAANPAAAATPAVTTASPAPGETDERDDGESGNSGGADSNSGSNSGSGAGSSPDGSAGESEDTSGVDDSAEDDAEGPIVGIFPYEDMQYLTLIIAIMAILCGVVLTILCIGVGLICYRRKKMQLKQKYESAYGMRSEFFAAPPQEPPYQALSQLDQYETPRYHTNQTLDIATRQLPELPPGHPSSNGIPPGGPDIGSLASSRIYTEPDLVSQIPNTNTLTRGSDSLARNVARAYAETDITQIQSGIFGGTFQMDDVLEYPKNNLIYLKDLGKGQFATVHLCVAPGITDGNPQNPVKVAVKFLHPDAHQEQREAFKKEVKVLSDLRHPNIIMLYGVCTRSGPPMMILEYMENGDLYQFLRRHEPDCDYRSAGAGAGGGATSSTIQTLGGLGGVCRTLGVGTLIHMGRQVAAGMSHVESVNFIHRDLASRNCLVGLGHTVKIGDFGMSRELYSNDYYKIEGKAVLPIRWMAWESIVMGKFSNKSDVWSFGVLLWELFTLAKCQPFTNRSDEQVIENLTNIWENKGSETLPQPNNCPDAIYELMLECWKHTPDSRPSFADLSTNLEKINQDYRGPVAV